MKTDILIVGSGCAALYFALQIPKDKKVLLITKADFESSDSFLAQGGICMLRDESDYQSYYEDTMRAGHNENDPVSVDIMIRSSQDVIRDLIACGVRFAKDENGALAFTREGAHSNKRILFHEDITGKEITSHLLEAVKRLPNVTLMEYTSMLDIVTDSVSDAEAAGGKVRHSKAVFPAGDRSAEEPFFVFGTEALERFRQIIRCLPPAASAASSGIRRISGS